MDSSDTVFPIATIRIAPFTALKNSPTTPHAVRAAENLRRWTRRNHYEHPAPGQEHPSPASLALFTLLSAKPHHLRFDLRPTPPTITVNIRTTVPGSVPAVLHPASDSLRLILWHLTRFKNHHSLPIAPCGFACDSSCGPSNYKNDFHLSHVFKATSRGVPLTKRPRRPNCQFLNLPDDVLLKIIFLLDPINYATLSDTHPYLKNFLLPIVPGLRLRLYPHQLHALSRMAEMEKPRLQPFPLLEELPVRELHYGHLMADLVDGSLMLLESVPRVQLPIGGLFCDEPGLGKTITALSLVLRTAGHAPKPPPGYETYVVTAPNGRELVAYKDNHICRFEMYGKTTADFPSRKARLLPGIVNPSKRRSTRRVRVPDFYAATKGLGALPVVEESRDIYLSGGTLIAVPPVLVPHWQSQIDRHVHTGTVKVLYLQSRENLPEEAIELASYDITLVSFDLLGELYSHLRNGAPIILQVHFLRVIVDEGHKLSSTTVTNFTSVCDRIRADVRWVMTGTPTPVTPRSDIDYLHSLLTFIHDEAYGLDKEAWRAGVRDPYSCYRKESLERLSSLLKRIMIRADKSILKAKCHVTNVILDFSEDTADSYNGLVRMARRNLITSDWYDPEHKESLLNPQNDKLAQAVMANLRKACCFGGTMDVMFDRNDIAETLDDLYEKYPLKAGIEKDDRFKDPIMEMHLLHYEEGEDDIDRSRREDIRRRYELYHVDRRKLRLSKIISQGPRQEGKTTMRMVYTGKLEQIGNSLLNCECSCAGCRMETKYPLVTPCGHLLCDDCVAENKLACVVRTCGTSYRMDDKHVPEDLIELQPSIQSFNWRDDWADTRSAKMSYLIKKIESLPPTEEWVKNEPTPRWVPPKVIVHSEYGDHLKLVALYMKGSEKLCNAYVEMVINTRDIHQDTRKIKRASEYAVRSVEKFRNDAGTQVLLMNTRHGAVGLDLSFVQYIFLLEPLWDAANELQIVSRAHRIGCKKNIFVERLIMKNSVEEDMVADLQTSVNRLNEAKLPGLAKAKAEKDQKKVARMLRNLRVVSSEREIEERITDTAANGHEMDYDISWTENQDAGNSSDSGPGSSEMESSESCPPSLAGVPLPRGALKRRREERENSSEPRRVRFRD